MRINDFAMFIPNAFFSVFKFIRDNIDEIGKEEIIKNGLYHVTQNEETAEKIIKSQHLRPSKGITKNIVSYGTACVCLFNGTPNIDNYIKNLTEFNKKTNPYLNPTMAVCAIKISPTEKSELTNYKVRSWTDNVVIYEGYCILPENKIQVVHLVPDLVREETTGKPLINPQTGKYEIKFREAKEDELKDKNKSYKAKEDYLQFIDDERKEKGYTNKKGILADLYNNAILLIDVSNTEGRMSQKNIGPSIVKSIKLKFKKLMTPKLDMGTDEKIISTINEFKYDKKNPYRDKKFGQAVAEFQQKGLSQLKLKEELEKITTSEIGEFFRKKSLEINQDLLVKNGIHNINHNNRVALLSMIIAKNEGLLKQDESNRTKDILLSAAYYHDIGRKKGVFVDNIGPHSKNSARKLKNVELKYLSGKQYTDNDRRILQAIVEAHEGKDKNMSKICKKYKIKDEDLNYTIKLMTILKDADALDRVRLDLNMGIVMKTDLNPKYLRTNTSKQLLDAAYKLEEISRKIPFDRILAYKTNEQKPIIKSKAEEKKEEFVSYLKKGVSQTSITIKQVKKQLKLRKNQISQKFHGKNIIDKVMKMLENRKTIEEKQEEK